MRPARSTVVAGGPVLDPFGHSWSIATHVKDLTPEEIQNNMAEAFES